MRSVPWGSGRLNDHQYVYSACRWSQMCLGWVCSPFELGIKLSFMCGMHVLTIRFWLIPGIREISIYNSLLLVSFACRPFSLSWILGVADKLVLMKCQLDHTTFLFVEFFLIPSWPRSSLMEHDVLLIFLLSFSPQFIEKHTLQPRLLAEIQKT